MNIPPAAGATRWPDVPACYDWLSLDRRGNWRLQGEPVTHAGLKRFLDEGYAQDEAGNWLVQNGPQRVFVALDYTPWVFRLQGDGSFATHTGKPAGVVDGAYLDDEGSVLLHTDAGIGLLDDRDLATFLAACKRADGSAVDDQAWVGLMAGAGGIVWQDLPLEAIARKDVAQRYHFRARPSP